MFLLAYLDRSNLGNARIEGLEQELHMKGTDYNVASMIFYLSYVLFEVPSNIMLKKFSPSTWLSTIMFFGYAKITFDCLHAGYQMPC
jgi:hypothetical protein